MARTIGIDLGTTNTVVAVLDDGRPRVLEDDRGFKVLPSVVSWKEEGRYVVGHAAKSRILTAPERTVWAVKRLIGRRYDSDEVTSARQHLGYRIERAKDGGCVLRVGDELMTPTEVSGLVLQVARQIAERALREEVTDAVITVPAYFNHAQRAATMEAAALAGLRCERLLNEPTSSALAYGFRKDLERTILIFDLGGGTFDVSVLRMAGGVYEILATSGHTYLGGMDLDERLVEHLADAFQGRTGFDPRRDPTSLQRLTEAAERAKCDLSFSDRATVVVPQLGAGENLEMGVTRRTFEELVEDLVQRTAEIARQAVGDAGLALSAIDDVVLVGGQTRMPRVREVISGLFGRAPSRSVHPEEVVALGAAVHGGSLASPEAGGTLLLDVTPFSLGIDVAGGLFSAVIDRNTKVPAARTRTFTTAQDHQEEVRIVVRQGQSSHAADNEFLSQFVLKQLRPAPRMEPKLDVTFRIDASGILHVTATDRDTGERQHVVVQNYGEVANAPGAGTPRADVGRVDLPAVAGPVSGSLPGVASDAGASALGVLSRLGGLVQGKGRRPKAAQPVAPAVAAPPQRAAGDAAVLPPPGIDLSRTAPAAGTVDLDAEDLEALDELEVSEGVQAASSARLELAEAGSLAPVAAAGWQPTPSLEDAVDLDAFEMPEDDGLDELLGGFVAGVSAPPSSAPAPPSPAPPSPAPPSPALQSPRVGVTPRVDHEEVFAMPEDDLVDEPLAVPPDGSFGEVPLDLSADLVGVDEDAALLGLLAGLPEELELEPLMEATVPVPDATVPTMPRPPAPQEPGGQPRKKPARLKVAYRRTDLFVSEYAENLARGDVFIPSVKPLALGRECQFEITVPGVENPIELVGVVTWTTRGDDGAAEPGMRVTYRLTPTERDNLKRLIAELS